MLQLFERIKSNRPETQIVTLYGELFGGAYNGVERRDVKPVQKHVYYCPHLEFYAFDIVVDKRFLHYDACIDLWRQCGFLFARVLKRGSFQNVFAFDVELLQSWIPTYFNLPPLKDNFAEGVVLKPVTYVANQYQELFLKKKQSKFVEVHKGKPKQFDRKIVLPSSNDFDEYLNDLSRYMTNARMESVLSKEGFIENEGDTKKLVGLFMADILNDWKKADDKHSLVLSSMSKPQRTAFYNSVMTQCQTFVHNYVKK